MKTTEQQKIEMVKIGDLKPFNKNPRKHSTDQIAQIAAAIQHWGWTMPILIDADRNIIAGHGRVLAAKQLGLKAVQCLTKRGKWTEAQRRAYIIADNKLTENAGWDMEVLKTEFGNLKELGFDLSLTGFAMNEIAGLLNLGRENDANEHWIGMPEFQQPDGVYRSIMVHFASEDDVNKFAELVGQSITDKTKFLWYPEAERDTALDHQYVSEEEQA